MSDHERGECDDYLAGAFGGPEHWCTRPLGHRGWHQEGDGARWRHAQPPAPAARAEEEAVSERFDDLDERHDDQCKGDGGGVLNCSCGSRQQQRVLAELHALRTAQPPAPADDTAEVLAGLVEEMTALADELQRMPADYRREQAAGVRQARRLVEAAQARLAGKGE